MSPSKDKGSIVIGITSVVSLIASIMYVILVHKLMQASGSVTVRC